MGRNKHHEKIKICLRPRIPFIRPILEHGNGTGDNCQQYEKDDLEKIQIEAARIAAGTTKHISIASLYSEIGWNSLDTYRKMQKLALFYKIVNHLTLLYLSSLILPLSMKHLDKI